MPIFGNGLNNSKTVLLLLRPIPNMGISGFVYVGVIFSAVNTTSQTVTDSGPPGGEVGTVVFRLFLRSLCLIHEI